MRHAGEVHGSKVGVDQGHPKEKESGGCGGTHLDITGGAIASESVWNDGPGNGAGGGGISDVFPVPDYQHDASIPPSVNPGGLGRPVGFLQPFLYSSAGVGTLHDVVTGSNGSYKATPGWDACTGLGSPDGAALLKGLSGSGS